MSAQTPPGGRYAQDGLSFDYPAGWALTDQSKQEAQHLILGRMGGSGIVMVIAYREPITKPEQLSAAHRNILRPYAEDMARKLGIDKTATWDEMQCLQIGERTAAGVRLSGRINGQPATAEVYALMLGRRFVNIFFLGTTRTRRRRARHGRRCWRL